MAGDQRYIHGYTREEQQRLVAQAEYWRDSLILPRLPYRPGERVLEVGCGAGAVLGVLGTAFPAVRLAGIDRAPEQVEYARRHLASLGHPSADLRQGDAARLPWEDGTFDHLYMMWFLEHVADPAACLAEARRVLRPGGTITINETDYSFTASLPIDPDLDYLFAAQRELFRRHGQPAIGRSLGALLAAGGFHRVSNVPMGFHHFTGAEGTGLRDFVSYYLGFIEPMVPRLAADLGLDLARLQAGVASMRALPQRSVASLTQIVFRAQAVR